MLNVDDQRGGLTNNGFTLVEILVVVAIIAIMSGLGIASYFRFLDRQRVYGAAMEAQVFLRDIQNRAKMGDRGDGVCATYSDAATVLSNRFDGWQVIFTGGTDIQARPVCSNGLGDAKTYVLPAQLRNRLQIVGDTMVFPSLYGNVSAGAYSCVVVRDTNNPDLVFSFRVAAGGAISSLVDNGDCGGV